MGLPAGGARTGAIVRQERVSRAPSIPTAFSENYRNSYSPKTTSPLASASDLPISREMRVATSSARALRCSYAVRRRRLVPAVACGIQLACAATAGIEPRRAVLLGGVGHADKDAAGRRVDHRYVGPVRRGARCLR